MQLKRGRPKKEEETFSDLVYKVAKILWRNGYKPFTRQNIIDYLESQMQIKVEPEQVTSALNYLKSKGLLVCKNKFRWYLAGKEYPNTQRYHYQYHPLPRCIDCVWLDYMKVKERIERKDGKIIRRLIKEIPLAGGVKKSETVDILKVSKNLKKKKNKVLKTVTRKYPICTCPYSMHYGKLVDVHVGRMECIATKPYAYEGYLTEEEIYKRRLHTNPFFPKKYYKLVDGKVVWVGAKK